MAELNEKFIVINKKHLFRIENNVHNNFLLRRFLRMLNEIQKKCPANKYYVCNQDEPYAEQIISIILKGEQKKVSKNV